jgi:hypothetical protein
LAILDPIQRTENGATIRGARVRVYIKNGPYHLTEMSVWADGQIQCWGPLITFERFQQKVAAGWVVTALPENAQVSVWPLGRFTAVRVENGVAEAELVKEVADLIDELNGRPTASHRCREALRAYQESPSEERKEVLRAAYEAVPSHRRIFLGDQDAKDWPIRRILEPEKLKDLLAVSDKAVSVAPSVKAQLDGNLQMALTSLYDHSGFGRAIFPRQAIAKVEALFRSGREETGLKRMRADLVAALKKHGNRPFVVIRLTAAMTSLGQYCAANGRVDEAVELLCEASRRNPDNLAPIELAKLAVARGDVRLARRLAALITDRSSEEMARALGLDLDSFRRLCRQPAGRRR